MARPATQADINSRLARLAPSGAGINPADIVEVVESVMASVSGDRSGINLRLHEDIEALAKFIQSAKAEIASLRADEINTKFLPTASDELSAIAGATEQATHEILTAVEAIETARNAMEPKAAAAVSDAVTRIYEACGFQDITGQRIAKVAKLLQDVETRVGGLLRALGEPVSKAPETPDAAGEDKPAEKSEEALKNGPQLPGNAMSQAEIDTLLASFD